MHGKLIRIGVQVITVILLCAACSVEKHHSVLSFFFDGVPNPDENLSDSITIDTLYAEVKTDTISTEINRRPRFITHQPFRDKDCNACHNKGKMGSINQPMPGLCFGCHTNFSEVYMYEHGPSSSGNCTACHQPHRTENDKLLLQPESKLCHECHVGSKSDDNIYHQVSEEERCITCHNPHGSSHKKLLQKGSCYLCHDDFKTEYSFLHGPVSSENCNYCHVSHRQELKLENEDRIVFLCLSCHVQNQLKSIDGHRHEDSLGCTNCHDPHGGSNRFFLN